MKIDIDQRTYSFALDVVRFAQRLPKNFISIELGRQLLRSATSVAANIEEAQGAFSRSDFIYKINISLKEIRETRLWLKLMKDSNITDDLNKIVVLIDESRELQNIIGTILKKLKSK